jgi:simple sugar transport system permease protein
LQGIAFVMILASEALRDTDWKALWLKLAKTSGPSPAQMAMGDKIV